MLSGIQSTGKVWTLPELVANVGGYKYLKFLPQHKLLCSHNSCFLKEDKPMILTEILTEY